MITIKRLMKLHNRMKSAHKIMKNAGRDIDAFRLMYRFTMMVLAGLLDDKRG